MEIKSKDALLIIITITMIIINILKLIFISIINELIKNKHDSFKQNTTKQNIYK